MAVGGDESGDPVTMSGLRMVMTASPEDSEYCTDDRDDSEWTTVVTTMSGHDSESGTVSCGDDNLVAVWMVMCIEVSTER